MSLGFKEKKLIDEYIELLALSDVSRFYPTAVSKHVSITPFEAFNYLLERSGPGKEVFLKWELQCPNLDCTKIIDIADEQRSGEEIECPRCNFEFELHTTDFIPVFVINKEYKAYLKEEQEYRNEKKKLKKAPIHI
ncbi:BRcat domain-containing protein [Virgibacillus halodenitrificans]|uniref:BRcat domain-containing protein n=1 Tax=Virgibacillus halodenitrificans TaxID=1482 RepID=UPI000EF50481|nr:IBR domain-containing protein [Virgibacillus halodenitrificans]